MSYIPTVPWCEAELFSLESCILYYFVVEGIELGVSRVHKGAYIRLHGAVAAREIDIGQSCYFLKCWFCYR